MPFGTDLFIQPKPKINLPPFLPIYSLCVTFSSDFSSLTLLREPINTKTTATTVNIVPKRQEKLREEYINSTRFQSLPLTTKTNSAAIKTAKKLITTDTKSVLASHKIHCFLFFTFLFLNY